MCFYEKTLDKLLINAEINKKSAYTTSNVGKILNISNTMVITLCDDWVPPKNNSSKTKGLECYKVGTHRRIPHHALIEYLKNNLYYNTLGV